MLAELIAAVRRNHALEHATVSVLLSRLGPSFRLVGRAARDGFYLYGDLPTEEIATASAEALRRLQRGEEYLAVSPLCGTNIAVAGVLAGLSSILALGSNPHQRLDRIPNVCLAAMLGIIAAQPVGRLVQKYLTTDPDVSGLRIVSVEERGRGPARYHKVRTEHIPA